MVGILVRLLQLYSLLAHFTLKATLRAKINDSYIIRLSAKSRSSEDIFAAPKLKAIPIALYS